MCCSSSRPARPSLQALMLQSPAWGMPSCGQLCLETGQPHRKSGGVGRGACCLRPATHWQPSRMRQLRHGCRQQLMPSGWMGCWRGSVQWQGGWGWGVGVHRSEVHFVGAHKYTRMQARACACLPTSRGLPDIVAHIDHQTTLYFMAPMPLPTMPSLAACPCEYATCGPCEYATCGPCEYATCGPCQYATCGPCEYATCGPSHCSPVRTLPLLRQAMYATLASSVTFRGDLNCTPSELTLPVPAQLR